MRLEKNTTIKSHQINDADIELIRRFTLTDDIDADKLYTFRVVLCDNEVDRDYEHFSIDALNQLATLFEGKTGIMDHSMRSKDQVARIYKTEVITDENQKTSLGEPLTQLVALAYVIKSQSNTELIEQIELGIKKEVSVACQLGSVICDICGNDKLSGKCNHVKGKVYGDKLCTLTLDDARDAYEFSFVAVPAQRGAGIAKSINENTVVMDNVVISKIADGILISFKDNNVQDNNSGVIDEPPPPEPENKDNQIEDDDVIKFMASIFN